MILDTNAYSGLARGLPAIVDIVSKAESLSLPLPVISELRYGFLKGSQAESNEQSLQRFLAQPQVSIIVPTLETTIKYATIQLFCQKRGKALSQNDIWIAALSLDTNDKLITFDKDFEILTELFNNNLIILDQ